MIITEVHARLKLLPYKDAGWKISSGPIRESRMVFVDILTDTGTVGQGCTSPGPLFISGESDASIVYAIESVLAKLLIGRNPFDIDEIMESMDKAAHMNNRAKAGIDLALHDLMGKALGVSVQSLIGSSKKQRIPVMRLIGLKEPEAMARDAAEIVQQGYKALKLKIGTGKRSDRERVEAVRRAVSDDVTVTVDMNGAFGGKEALEVIEALEPCHVALVEQPVRREDIAGLAFVRQRSPLPVEVDESVITLADAARVIEAGAADFISVKLLKMGGIHKAKKVAALCEAFGICCVIGCTPGSQMVDVASGHFFASTANVWWAAEIGEFPRMLDDPVQGAVLKEGFLEVPDGPGFGLKVNC